MYLFAFWLYLLRITPQYQASKRYQAIQCLQVIAFFHLITYNYILIILFLVYHSSGVRILLLLISGRLPLDPGSQYCKGPKTGQVPKEHHAGRSSSSCVFLFVMQIDYGRKEYVVKVFKKSLRRYLGT